MMRHKQYSGAACLMKQTGTDDLLLNLLQKLLAESRVLQNGCLICFSNPLNRLCWLAPFMRFVSDGGAIGAFLHS